MPNKFLILLFLPIAMFADFRPKETNNLVILLSFPRTGTCWASSSIQILTQRCCYYVSDVLAKSYSGNGLNFLNTKIDQNKPPFIRTHFPFAITSLRKPGNKLIVLSRSHRETVLRMGKLNSQGRFDRAIFDTFYENSPTCKNLSAVYKFFDAWPEDDRLLIEYEDLVLNPVKAMKSILTFINEPETNLDHYEKNLDHYRQKMVKTYSSLTPPKKWGGSLSKGDDPLFHSKQASKNDLQIIDEFIRKKVGEDLWQKYFAKYAIDI